MSRGEQDAPPGPRSRPLITVLRRALPWVIAVGLLALLFRRAGGAAVRDAARDADFTMLAVATLLSTLAMFTIDCVALSRLISWFNVPIRGREIAPVKAATYLINIVNYNAGSGAIALWLKRRKGVPFLEAVSTLLFMNAVDALVLVAFMAATLPVLDGQIRDGVFLVVVLAAAAFVGNLCYWRGGFDFFVLGRLRGLPIFASFRQARVSHYLWLAAIRVPFNFCFILNTVYGLQAFGIEVPFLKVLAFVPLLAFVSIVPVTVAGLGTVQAATVFFFLPYASEARILAFSLAMTLAMNGMRALLGVPFFQRVSEDIFRGDAGNGLSD